MPVQKLFRKTPPKEFVNEILQACGFLGLHDLRWFSKEELELGGIEVWLPLLEPYYLPCKASRFVSDVTTAKLITILRHITAPHGYVLHHTERMYKDKKQTLYQLVPTSPFQDLSGASLEVSFE